MYFSPTGFEILTTVIMNRTVFWDMTAYRAVEVHHITDECTLSSGLKSKSKLSSQQDVCGKQGEAVCWLYLMVASLTLRL
jgi:hypothetical protein